MRRAATFTDRPSRRWSASHDTNPFSRPPITTPTSPKIASVIRARLGIGAAVPALLPPLCRHSANRLPFVAQDAKDKARTEVRACDSPRRDPERVAAVLHVPGSHRLADQRGGRPALGTSRPRRASKGAGAGTALQGEAQAAQEQGRQARRSPLPRHGAAATSAAAGQLPRPRDSRFRIQGGYPPASRKRLPARPGPRCNRGRVQDRGRGRRQEEIAVRRVLPHVPPHLRQLAL